MRSLTISKVTRTSTSPSFSLFLAGRVSTWIKNASSEVKQLRTDDSPLLLLLLVSCIRKDIVIFELAASSSRDSSSCASSSLTSGMSFSDPPLIPLILSRDSLRTSFSNLASQTKLRVLLGYPFYKTNFSIFLYPKISTL